MGRRNTRLIILVATCCCALAAGCPGPDPTYLDGAADYTLVGDSLGCLPDNDGRIERSELVFKAGLAANYRANPPGTLAPLNPKGKLVNGKVEWDFSATDGVVTRLEVDQVSGTWFAKHFPTGNLAMVTSVKGDTLQVLQVESDRVLLLGLASRKPDYTLTIYDPPVTAMKFPLKKGLKFSATSSLKDGSKINGLPVTAKDTYEVSINTEGILRLPHLRLHRTLLIETKVTSRTVGGKTVTTRQLQWFSECYGEVVRALSQTDEKAALFEKALELRRLAF